MLRCSLAFSDRNVIEGTDGFDVVHYLTTTSMKSIPKYFKELLQYKEMGKSHDICSLLIWKKKCWAVL